MSEQQHEPYAGWAIVELFGHRKLAGRVAQVEQYGQAMLRIDVPHEGGSESTHFFGGDALYGVHPTTEEIARHVAHRCDPSPVQRWELPALPEPSAVERCGGCGGLEEECTCPENYDYHDGPLGEEEDAA